MKKLLFSISLILFSIFSNAQTIEITPMGGYSFIGGMNFYEGRVNVLDNASYGIKIGFSPIEHSVLEFSYQGTETSAKWEPYNSWGSTYPREEFPVNTNFFTLSFQHERMLTSDKVYGFGGLGMGMAYYHPTGRNVSDVYSFAVTVDLGVKIFLTDRIGIRLQGGLQMPLYFQGFGMYVGSGGSGLSMNAGTYAVQGGFSAGVIFRLGELH